MLKRILQTVALIVSGVIFIPAILIETLSAIIHIVAVNMSFKEGIIMIITQYKDLWEQAYVNVFKDIWSKD